MVSTSLTQLTGISAENSQRFSLDNECKVMYKGEGNNAIIKIQGRVMFTPSKSKKFPNQKPKLQLEVESGLFSRCLEMQSNLYDCIKNQDGEEFGVDVKGFSRWAVERNEEDPKSKNSLNISFNQGLNILKTTVPIFLIGSDKPIYDMSKLVWGSELTVYCTLDGVNDFYGTQCVRLMAEKVQVNSVGKNDLSEQCNF